MSTTTVVGHSARLTEKCVTKRTIQRLMQLDKTLGPLKRSFFFYPLPVYFFSELFATEFPHSGCRFDSSVKRDLACHCIPDGDGDGDHGGDGDTTETAMNTRYEIQLDRITPLPRSYRRKLGNEPPDPWTVLHAPRRNLAVPKPRAKWQSFSW